MGKAIMSVGPVRASTADANGFRREMDSWSDKDLRDARRMGSKRSSRLFSPVRDVKNFRVRVRDM